MYRNVSSIHEGFLHTIYSTSTNMKAFTIIKFPQKLNLMDEVRPDLILNRYPNIERILAKLRKFFTVSHMIPPTEASN